MMYKVPFNNAVLMTTFFVYDILQALENHPKSLYQWLDSFP